MFHLRIKDVPLLIPPCGLQTLIIQPPAGHGHLCLNIPVPQSPSCQPLRPNLLLFLLSISISIIETLLKSETLAPSFLSSSHIPSVTTFCSLFLPDMFGHIRFLIAPRPILAHTASLSLPEDCLSLPNELRLLLAPAEDVF